MRSARRSGSAAAPVVVVGAGVAGLAAAADLAGAGLDVLLLDRAAEVGGKMREVRVAGAGIDGGPTVFTMRWVFDSLFAAAGRTLEGALALEPLQLLARHAWSGGGQLDLYADVERSSEAIGRFAGARDARGYREFCARSAAVYRSLKDAFIAAPRPSPLALVRRLGVGGLGPMLRTPPSSTLWKALAGHFADPRLRQLFGRYATYVGSSPFAAPATLMLIAHVEQDGVWRVVGGMRRLAEALESLAVAQGARRRCGAHVRRLLVERGVVRGVELAGGERIEARAVVYAGDAAALADGSLGEEVRGVARRFTPARRSLSAITWCVTARTRGFDLTHHNVFFADDYAAEFDWIFRRRGISPTPTVYVCAQDRGANGIAATSQSERLLLLINAPADGDQRRRTPEEIARHAGDAFAVMRACGLDVDVTPGAGVATAPHDFHAMFPATGGALYGIANHGPWASFDRPGSACRVAGLYLAGGSVHPGAGVPMATMSGRLAAARLLADVA